MRSFYNRFLTSLIVIVSLFISASSFAAYLTFVPQTITQPDSTEIQCFASGDEFYNWLHDEDGFTIIQSKTDGYYYFAGLTGEVLAPTVHLAGQADPASVGLLPWTNIPPFRMEEIRSDFLQNFMPEKPPIEGYQQSSTAGEFDIFNNLVVYIRFSDQGEWGKDTVVYWNMFNNTSPGYNSMQNYFWDVTYQELEMPSHFYPIPSGQTVISYEDIFPRAYYMPYNASTNPTGYHDWQRGEREHALLKRAIEYIEEEVPESLDIDGNDDGYVDNVVFNIRGAPTAWSTLLWPHRWVLYNETVYINGKQVWDYNFQIETELDSRGNGVLCHETYHSLGAPDLYHYGSSPFVSCGRWDIMDQNMNPPQSMGAYMKYRYGGWIEEIPEITECGVYTINPITEPENNCFKIASPNSTTEYFVVEYRKKEGPFESSVPSTGLVVYRIDKKYDGDGNAGGPPDEVYIYRPGGTNESNGNLSDANFSAEEGRTEINDGTDPSSFLQNGSPGGLDISNVSSAGETISFEVTFETAPIPDFEASRTLLTEGCSVDFTDYSACDVDSWEWTFEGGTPSASSEQNPEGVVFSITGTYDVTLTATNSFGSNSVTFTDYIEVSNTALPVVEFEAEQTVVCTGDTITLLDMSEVCPEAWTWEFTPNNVEFLSGTDANSQNPKIRIEQLGAVTVKLTVENANGSADLIKEDYLSIGGTELPYAEDFEASKLSNTGWTVKSADEGITWESMAVAGNGSSRAAGINMFDYFSFMQRDQLISPPINLEGFESVALQFDHAYALLEDIPVYSDSLIIKISTDCGETWTRIAELVDDGEGSFATHEPLLTRFIPQNANDWCGSGYGSACYEIDISQWSGSSNVKIMFETVRILGNNLYIDNVRVGPFTGMENQIANKQEGISIYPNPSDGIITIRLNDVEDGGLIEVYNTQGQLISQKETGSAQNSIELNLGQYPEGLYFIVFNSGGTRSTRKVLIR